MKAKFPVTVVKYLRTQQAHYVLMVVYIGMRRQRCRYEIRQVNRKEGK
jgi:hypothetical protein